MTRVLFVCSANIVRSFMAERILRNRLQRKGRTDVAVSSAGLLEMGEAPADKTARQVLRENGIEDTGHLSRLLRVDLVAEADLIVTLENGQAEKICAFYPQAAGKCRLLKSYLPSPGAGDGAEDVKDPCGLSIFHYRLCFAEICLAVEEMQKCI
jgi:protein-tyrosine phosphatase